MRGGVSLVFIILTLVLLSSGCDVESNCGNGVVEAWETPENCCVDTGCIEPASCIGKTCVMPPPTVCIGCQYLENGTCHNYECCNDGDCADGKQCSAHICIGVQCAECQYFDKGECKYYECCEDIDCATGEECKSHSCKSKTCGDCEYLENGICKKYECCEDDDCSDSKECESHACVSLSCGYCKYVSDHKCVSYECCEDDDCGIDGVCHDNECLKVVRCGEDDGQCPDGCKAENDVDCEESVDCDDDLDCLADYADDCKLAELRETFRATLNQVEHNIEAVFEVRGTTGEKCSFYMKIVDVDIDFSDALIQDRLDSGDTQDEINDKEDEVEASGDTFEGKEGICKYVDPNDLNDLIQSWVDSDFTGGVECDRHNCEFSNDWAEGECSGELFN